MSSSPPDELAPSLPPELSSTTVVEPLPLLEVVWVSPPSDSPAAGSSPDLHQIASRSAAAVIPAKRIDSALPRLPASGL